MLGQVFGSDRGQAIALSFCHSQNRLGPGLKIRNLNRGDQPGTKAGEQPAGQSGHLRRVDGARENHLVVFVKMAFKDGKKLIKSSFLPRQKVNVIEDKDLAFAIPGVEGSQVPLAGRLDVLVGKGFG